MVMGEEHSMSEEQHVHVLLWTSAAAGFLMCASGKGGTLSSPFFFYLCENSDKREQ